MSITPNDPANFTPTLQGYTGQGAFRFWCQTVLPLVYDDSLSYYELLNKVVHYLNNVISDVSTVETNVGEIVASFDNLQDYVNNNYEQLVETYNTLEQYVDDYFTNLDVRQEINTKLDQMAASGALSVLLAPLIPDLVTNWLSEHITPTTPVVDDTLTISGAAADSKVTGDEITDLKRELNNCVTTDLMEKCQLVIIEPSANVWDTTTASTGFLHTNGTVYTGGSYDDYKYNSIGSVSQGDIITSYKYVNNAVEAQPMQMVVAYDNSGNVMSASGASNVTTYTVPAGVASVSITYSNAQLAQNVMVLINAESAPTTYIPYIAGKKYYIATPDFIPEYILSRVVDNTLSISGKAADSKVTGDEITDLKRELNNCVTTDLMEKCQLVIIEPSANVWDTTTASTGFLHTNGTVYTGGSYDDYKYNSIGSVSQGDIITSYKYVNNAVEAQPMQMVVAYDNSGNVMSASGASNVTTYTVPAGVASVSITYSNAQLAQNVMVLINAESAPTTYIPYIAGKKYYIATPDFIPEYILSGKVDKNGTNQVTAKNAEFIYVSPNLFDETRVNDGYFVNQITGELEENPSNSSSDYIDVDGGEKYTLSSTLSRAYRYYWYDSNKTPIINSGALTNNITNITLTAPQNAKYFRFSTTEIYSAIIQFEKGETKTEYVKYGTAYLLPQYSPANENNKLNLPSKIYATVGYELNIYFENLIEEWEQFKWDVSCPKGVHLERGFRVTPSAGDVGTYVLLITATHGQQTITATASLIISAQSAGSGTTKKIIILGDSTTNSGIAVAKLNQNFSDDTMSIQTLGTRGTSPNNHEGRSGWTFAKYFEPPNSGDIALGVANPFYNPTTQTFDARYYFTNTGIAIPDWFFINLGINDTFGYTTDEKLESAIETIKGLCDDMIESIQDVTSSIKIGLCITIPPNHSQDAFGKAYSCGQTRDRYKRNNYLWANAIIEEYGDKESDGIYLIPIHTNLDTIYNMGMEADPVNARNTSVTYESPIGNGGVHPVESGYWQIADVYTAFLKAHA